MPAFAPIVINDGKSTPVAHTFSMTSNGGGRMVTHNRAAPTLQSQENLTVEVKQPAGKNGAYRSSVSLGHPVALTDPNGKVIVDHVSSSRSEFNFAQGSSLAERNDVVTMHINALSNLLIREAVLDNEPFYS